MKTSPLLYIVAFVLLFIFTRVPRLHNDVVSTDAVYWHDRAEKFINALKAGDFKETYQMYHPGVTLMWITGLTSEVYSRVKGISTDEVFSNFVTLHYYAKLTLVLWQLTLSVYIIYLLSKIFEFKKAIFMVALFSFEPFFVGNSRLLHLDAQISLYILIGLSLSYLNARKFSFLGVVLAGFFFGLATLSKTLFIGGVLFGLFAGGLLSFINNGLKASLKYTLTLLFSFLLTYLLLFPAFWTALGTTLSTIINDSAVVGNKLGHKQIYFGELKRNPGPTFYPVLLLLKLSLVTLVGFILYFWKQFMCFIKKLFTKSIKIDLKNISFTNFIVIFYFAYFIVITYFSKKVDRYTIPLFPFLGIVAVLGYYSVIYKNKAKLLVVIILFSIVYPLFRVFPHYLTYTNPIIGNADTGNKIIGQKLFGIGVFDLREFIIEKYGPNTKVSINDPGPLKSIYGENMVYNISEEHPNSYKLMILGPNKKPPPSVVNSGVRFIYKDSIYINGLEFWRIYKKSFRHVD